jgi:hypothetical protein
MDNDEGPLLAESVATGCLDFDLPKLLPCDLTFESLVHVHRIARAAAGVSADGDNEVFRGALLEYFFLEPVEALVCSQFL